MTTTSKANKTRWHRLLGSLLEQLLTPVGISVQCDVKVMVNPPEADILLLRRQTPQWTEEQLARLADGIRDSKATDILLEFKCTESVNDKALLQTLAYDFFYKRANNFSDRQVQSFLISAKTPRSKVLSRFSFRQGQHKGVYFSSMPLAEPIVLIVLNELSNEPHNAWIKCFSSRQLEKEKAFKVIKAMGLNLISSRLGEFLWVLWKHWFSDIGEFDMSTELTAEKVIEMGKFWGQSYVSSLKPKEILSMVNHQEIVAELDAKERLTGLSVEEIETFLQQMKAQQS